LTAVFFLTMKNPPKEMEWKLAERALPGALHGGL